MPHLSSSCFSPQSCRFLQRNFLLLVIPLVSTYFSSWYDSEKDLRVHERIINLSWGFLAYSLNLTLIIPIDASQSWVDFEIWQHIFVSYKEASRCNFRVLAIILEFKFTTKYDFSRIQNVNINLKADRSITLPKIGIMWYPIEGFWSNRG